MSAIVLPVLCDHWRDEGIVAAGRCVHPAQPMNDAHPSHRQCMRQCAMRVVAGVEQKREDNFDSGTSIDVAPWSPSETLVERYRRLWKTIFTAALGDLSKFDAVLDEVYNELPANCTCDCRSHTAAYRMNHPPDLSSNESAIAWAVKFYNGIAKRINGNKISIDTVRDRANDYFERSTRNR